MRNIPPIFYVASVILGLCAPCPAALDPGGVPTFRLRARVVAADKAGAPEKSPATRTAKVTFRLDKATAPAAPGEWSEWMTFDHPAAERAVKEYPNLYMNGYPLVMHLRVEPAFDPTVVDVELRLDETGEVIALRGELFGPTLGLLVWRDADTKLASGKPAAGTMADYNRQFLWPAVKGARVPPERRPRKFPIADRFIGGDDDRINWREGFAALAGAGFNTIQAPASKPLRGLLAQAGIERTGWAVYSPPGYAFPEGEPGAGKTAPKSPDAWARHEASEYLEAGYQPGDVALFAMSDEPGWYYPAAFKLLENPTAMARFHDYLKAQGLNPADLGAVEWEQVKPLGRSAVKDLSSRRLFYWTMRFFPYDSTRYFADCTAAMERAFYPGLPLTTNFNFFAGRFYVPGPVANNPDKQNPDAAMGGHDWLEFGRLRGCTMMWTEDWFPDGQAWQWSFYCARLRCAAEKRQCKFGGYVVPRAAGDRADGLLQKALCLVGSGGKAINTYVFGPEYNFPGNCYSNRPQLLAKLAEANAMIGAGEDLLWEGTRPRPQAAILWPRSAQPWDLIDAPKDRPADALIQDATATDLNSATVDYMAEAFDQYVALQHANIPADIVDEDDLSPRGLAAYRVLYVTEPDIPEEAQHGISQWVRDGGTLVTISGAGQSDRYDEPCKVLAGLIAANERPRPRMLVPALSTLKNLGKVHGEGGDAIAYGARGVLDQPAGDVRATFEDGTPAIVERAEGNGRVVHFAWLPGISYFRSADRKTDGLPAGFSPALRRWIAAPALRASVEPPVTVDVPMVETPVLLSPHGAAVTLLNWTGSPIPRLTLQARLPFAVKTAESIRAGRLAIETEGNVLSVSLPVGSADVVLLRP